MSNIYQEHGVLTLLAWLIIAIVVLATVYSFWRKRFIDNGPRKGEAANPEKVRRQNPPDR